MGILRAALDSARVPHAYLFSGPAGTGKKTAARRWAQTVLCGGKTDPARACGDCPACARVMAGAHPDLLWVDFAFQAALLGEPEDRQRSIRIGTIREMERVLRLKPLEGAAKVAVLARADDLVDAAGHALLKIVEEPPPGTHLVLISEEAGSLLPTLRSRTQRVAFSPLAAETIAAVLAARRPETGPEEREAAARTAGGSVLRAMELLDESGLLDFDWERAPLPELLAWGEGFQNPRLGRGPAERWLEALVARFQGETREGRRPVEDLRRAFAALGGLRRNAAVGLTLQHLLLHLRRDARRRGETAP